MEIIIIGCGKVGLTLADQLVKENHNVVMVDTSSERLQSLSEEIDAIKLLGNGASISTQMEAGIETAEVWLLTSLPGAKRPSRVFPGLWPEARHTPRRPLSLPYGLGGSAPSPYAPPRQALCTDPFEHSVEGFCGAARVEWAGPVWAKNRSGRALTCVSFPPSQRRAPFRGIHKGVSPLCVLFILLFAQAKNKPSARTGPGIPCR